MRQAPWSRSLTVAPARSSALDPDGSLRELAGDCVHCGFCLPACPTYQLWGEEMDSPRGRIHLHHADPGERQGSQAAAEHFDRCLGCMACVTACPSGVQYDQLIEAARAWADDGESPRSGNGGGPATAPFPPRSLRDRAVRAAIFATFPYPARLRAALGPLRAAQRTGLDRLAERSQLLARLAPEAVAALAVAPRPAAHGAAAGADKASADGGGRVTRRLGRPARRMRRQPGCPPGSRPEASAGPSSAC